MTTTRTPRKTTAKTPATKAAAPRTAAKTTTLRVLDPNQVEKGYWMEVHADGCADLSRGRRGQTKGAGSWTIEAATMREAAIAISSDFIAEGSMTEDEALEHVYFAPCVKLPRGARAPRKTAAKAPAKRAALQKVEVIAKTADEVYELTAARLLSEMMRNLGIDKATDETRQRVAQLVRTVEVDDIAATEVTVARTMDPKDVGRFVTQIRTAAGVDTKELASRMGTSDGAIRRLERGDTNATVAYLARVAKALNVALVIGTA